MIWFTCLIIWVHETPILEVIFVTLTENSSVIMTPRDLTNIHTTGNSCRDALPCANMALKLSWYFTCWWRSLLVAASKFGLLTMRRHNATIQHLFPYPQGDRSDLRKQKMISINTNHSYHQRSSDLTIKPNSVLTNSIEKYGLQSWSM